MNRIVVVIAVLCISGAAHSQELTASYYDIAALKRDGQWAITQGRCANGEQFRDEGLTAASWDFPLNTMVKVTSKETGRSVIVRVSDRTARRFTGKRIDLSKRAFEIVSGGRLDKGILSVRVERIY